MKETEQATFDRVFYNIRTFDKFEIAKAYYTERKIIEAEAFTCKFSGESFEVDEIGYINAFAIDNNRIDTSPRQGNWKIFWNSIAFFSTHSAAIGWNQARFKTKG